MDLREPQERAGEILLVLTVPQYEVIGVGIQPMMPHGMLRNCKGSAKMEISTDCKGRWAHDCWTCRSTRHCNICVSCLKRHVLVHLPLLFPLGLLGLSTYCLTQSPFWPVAHSPMQHWLGGSWWICPPQYPSFSPHWGQSFPGYGRGTPQGRNGSSYR